MSVPETMSVEKAKKQLTEVDCDNPDHWERDNLRGECGECLAAILEAVDAAAYQRGCMDVETFDQNILAEHIAAAEKRGEANAIEAMAVAVLIRKKT